MLAPDPLSMLRGSTSRIPVTALLESGVTATVAQGTPVNQSMLHFQYPVEDFGTSVFKGDAGCTASKVYDILTLTTQLVPAEESTVLAIKTYRQSNVTPRPGSNQITDIIYFDLQSGNIVYASPSYNFTLQLNEFDYTVLVPNVIDLPRYLAFLGIIQQRAQSLVVGANQTQCNPTFPQLQVVVDYLASVQAQLTNSTNVASALRPTEVRLPGGCISETSANYEGTLIQSLRGQQFSQGDCCDYCKNTTGCNVWTWCPSFEGCRFGDGQVFPAYACDLKFQDSLTDPGQQPLAYSRGPPTSFTSGRYVQ
jgi:hypothetical protein